MLRSIRTAGGRATAALSWMFACLIVGGCGPDPASPRIEQILLPADVRRIPRSTLEAAPPSLTVQGRDFEVDAALWWNLQPSIGPSEPRRLIAAVTLRVPGETDFPAGI